MGTVMSQVMEQLLNRFDVAMFNAILFESAEEMPIDPVSDPISDSKVLPMPAGRSSFGAGAQLKNVKMDSADDIFILEDEKRLKSFKAFRLLHALSDLMMLPFGISTRKGGFKVNGKRAIWQWQELFDPNGRQCLTMEGYRKIGQIVRKMADKHCDGRIMIVQEGGYHVTYSAYCLHATLEGVLNLPDPLLSDPIVYYPEDEAFTTAVIDLLRSIKVNMSCFLNRL
ncbi:histone deacetylase 8 [Phtheirospermum japonicum]|uniref:Histone deacetylase 8 n=1 Tax=Phtheirospermum japonicum TaxID=374723 RepID=A0A830BNV7_9LAMI|nr:histone deacetylase 8 [Phtheirospermum japonicum]